MAQTISTIRGSTTVTGNGGTTATLFTNSGTGVGTRVIINQISYSSGNANINGDAVYSRLQYTASGAGTTNIGNTYWYSQSVAPSSKTYSYILGGQDNPAVYNNTNNIPIYGNPLYVNDILEASQGTTKTVYTLCPQTFWIGPGDSVKFAAFSRFNPGGKSPTTFNTVSVRYSFTLITES